MNKLNHYFFENWQKRLLLVLGTFASAIVAMFAIMIVIMGGDYQSAYWFLISNFNEFPSGILFIPVMLELAPFSFDNEENYFVVWLSYIALGISILIAGNKQVTRFLYIVLVIILFSNICSCTGVLVVAGGI